MKHSILRKFMLAALFLLSLALLAGCTAQTPQVTATPVPQAATVAPEPTATEAPAATPTPEPTATQAPAATPTPESTATEAPTATPAESAQKVFNAEELALYNGENGNPAYIAVDGVVYDVTDVLQWKNGSHFGRFQAGANLTEEIKTISPHGVSKLDGLPVVGTYEP